MARGDLDVDVGDDRCHDLGTSFELSVSRRLS